MNKIDKTTPKLLNMLGMAEDNLKKSKPNYIIMGQKGHEKGKSKAKNRKNKKNKTDGKSKSTSFALKSKGGIAKKGQCFHYNRT